MLTMPHVVSSEELYETELHQSVKNCPVEGPPTIGEGLLHSASLELSSELAYFMSGRSLAVLLEPVKEQTACSTRFLMVKKKRADIRFS